MGQELRDPVQIIIAHVADFPLLKRVGFAKLGVTVHHFANKAELARHVRIELQELAVRPALLDQRLALLAPVLGSIVRLVRGPLLLRDELVFRRILLAAHLVDSELAVQHALDKQRLIALVLRQADQRTHQHLVAFRIDLGLHAGIVPAAAAALVDDAVKIAKFGMWAHGNLAAAQREDGGNARSILGNIGKGHHGQLALVVLLLADLLSQGQSVVGPGIFAESGGAAFPRPPWSTARPA